MSNENQYLWTLTRFWGGVLLYTITLGAGLINSYNSGEFAAQWLNIVIPVLLLVIAVSIAVLGYARDKEEVE